MKKKNSVSMAVVNAHAAGIDVGSRQHYVAVGQEPQDVLIHYPILQKNLFYLFLINSL